MKKIFYLLLFACSFNALTTATGKTGNTKPLKGSSNNEKTTNEKTIIDRAPTETNPKLAPAKGKVTGREINILAREIVNNAAGAPFYVAKKKRNINLKDVYVGVGGGYLTSKAGSNKDPFKNGISINGSYGVPLINKYLILEINNEADFMFSPNMDWFSKAFSLPKSSIRGVGMGFYEKFGTGLQVVIIGSRMFTFTAGPVLSANLNMLPSMNLNGSVYFLTAPVTLCYGLKANVFIGDHFYCYLQYSNTATSGVTGQTSQSTSDMIPAQRQVPVDFGVLNTGVGYVLKAWW